MTSQPVLEPAEGSPVSAGKQLRSAREAAGLSIAQVSTALRIPELVIAALENEELGRLPEPIYISGLIRNYARHLKIAPEQILSTWPAGASVPLQRDARPSAPRERSINVGSAEGAWVGLRARSATTWSSLAQRVLQLGSIRIFAVGVGIFLALQFVRFITPPSVTVSVPVEDVITLQEGVLVATLSGTSPAGARINVTASGGSDVAVVADEQGNWSLQLPLSYGRTEVEMQAEDAATGSLSGEIVRRVFIVPLPAEFGPMLTAALPLDGVKLDSLPLGYELATAPGQEVAFSASSDGIQSISLDLLAGADGHLSGEIFLPAGEWVVRFSAAAPSGQKTEVERSVSISYSGAVVAVVGTEGSTWVRAWSDGAVESSIGPNGSTIHVGEEFRFAADRVVELRFGDPRAVTITLNGRILKPLGTPGVLGSWSFNADGTVNTSARK